MKYSKRFISLVATLSLCIGIVFGSLGVTTVQAVLKGSAVFPDVRTGTYFDDAVGEMYNAGIIKGYEDGKFGPNDFVTRGQVAVLMKRLRDDIGGGGGSSATEEEETPAPAQNEAGTIRFTVDSFDINEDVAVATVSVIRAGGTAGAVSIDYATSDGTALEDADYVEATGTLNYADGESSKTFTVEILNDVDDEGDEELTITLSNVSGGAELGSPNTATLTINDDDVGTSFSDAGRFNFSAVSYQIAEDAESITISVIREEGSQGSVQVGYATSDGSADSGQEYESSNGTMTFDAGETSKSFTVEINDDTDIGGNKTVNLTLSDPTNGAQLGDYATAIITIMDDEAVSVGTGSFRFSSASYDVDEGNVDAIILVKRVGGAHGTASINYEAYEGSAIDGADFNEVNGTLTFADGEAEKKFMVEILDDSVNESNETVNLRILDPTNGATLGSPAIATLYIN